MTRQRLHREIDIELSFLERTVADVEGLLAMISDRAPNSVERAAAGTFLAQFYNGIENILKRICVAHNVTVSQGDQSHAELFQMFCSNQGTNLPMLFPDNIRGDFSILRRFRHFFFHGYSFQIEWEGIIIGMRSLRSIFEDFRKNVAEYFGNEAIK
jgi:hypothetical protein